MSKITLKSPKTLSGASEMETAKRYTRELVSRLTFIRTSSLVTWAIINVLIVIGSLLVLIFASIGLQILITNNQDLLLAGDLPVVSAVTVSSFTIFSFLLEIIISVYTSLMKWRIYKGASERIQNETFKYYAKSDEYATGDAGAAFATRAQNIITEAEAIQKQVSIKTILLKILTKGAYDK